jgi:hypothetical protein
MTNHKPDATIHPAMREEAHMLMEQALILLDQAGETTAAAYLDHAIESLGLPRLSIAPEI